MNAQNKKLNDDLKTIEHQEVLKIVNKLLSMAKPKDYIKSVNDGHLANIQIQMKEFKLKGKDISNMRFLNNGLIEFLYDLETLSTRLKIYKEINSITEI